MLRSSLLVFRQHTPTFFLLFFLFRARPLTIELTRELRRSGRDRERARISGQ